MQVHFAKLSPTQNMTLLITSPLRREAYAECALKLMRYESLNAEQTGFVEQPENCEAAARLQMMGGEFCGNALMALAVWVARNQGLSAGETSSMLLECSGSEKLVECYVTAHTDHFVGEIEIPTPRGLQEKTLFLEEKELVLQSVELPGITHLLLTDSLTEGEQKEVIRRITAHRAEFTHADALGILFLDPTTHYLTPVVHVRSLDTLVWERGCGSGSAAAGYALSTRDQKSHVLALEQPGGSIRVSTEYEKGRVQKIWIEGTVHIVAEGVAYY